MRHHKLFGCLPPSPQDRLRSRLPEEVGPVPDLGCALPRRRRKAPGGDDPVRSTLLKRILSTDIKIGQRAITTSWPLLVSTTHPGRSLTSRSRNESHCNIYLPPPPCFSTNPLKSSNNYSSSFPSFLLGESSFSFALFLVCNNSMSVFLLKQH